MSQLIGVAAGIFLGCIVGLLKNIFVWGSYLRNQNSNGDTSKEQTMIMKKSIVSYLVCLGVLLAIYLLRGVLPFDWIYCLIATGLCISMMNVLIASKKKHEFK